MAKFTTKDYHTAREWAEMITSDKSTFYNDPCRKAAEIIMSIEIPEMNMSEIPWKDEEHFLAEAENKWGDNYIMLAPETDKNGNPNGWISVLHHDETTVRINSTLYPTGRRATLNYPERKGKE